MIKKKLLFQNTLFVGIFANIFLHNLSGMPGIKTPKPEINPTDFLTGALVPKPTKLPFADAFNQATLSYVSGLDDGDTSFEPTFIRAENCDESSSDDDDEQAPGGQTDIQALVVALKNKDLDAVRILVSKIIETELVSYGLNVGLACICLDYYDVRKESERGLWSTDPLHVLSQKLKNLAITKPAGTSDAQKAQPEMLAEILVGRVKPGGRAAFCRRLVLPVRKTYALSAADEDTEDDTDDD